MIAIVDGGSTKSAWSILDTSLNTVLDTQTIGFNAYLTTQEELMESLSQNPDLTAVKDDIQQIFFYNAGCGTVENQQKFEAYLQSFFTNAHIRVRGDLLASAYALYNGKPMIAGILGTGSNSCFFDGEKIHKHIPSLGYVLGDEGGGVALGKKLLKSYFYQTMPKDLREKFQEQFHLTLNEVLNKVYSQPKANAYIGNFATFLTANKNHSFCKKLVEEEIQLFFETQILPYRNSDDIEVGLVGSITFYFEKEIRNVAENLDLKIGKLIKNPLNDLVDYHKQYMIK